jgi:iron complex outermembrane receptor protein
MKKAIVLSTLCALALSLQASDLGNIEVTSSTINDSEQSLIPEVSTVATLSAEKVESMHIENLQQVLQSIPGVTTESKTGDSIKIHLRGVENQMYMGEKPGVAIVIDGVPVFERTGAVNVDLDNIESIKVIKGGASYLFGDDALSGAVIITTKKGAKYNHNFATAEVGSYGFRKYLARSGYANEDLSFHIQASQRKADGYWEDSDYDSKYLDGKFQYYIDDTSDITFGAEYSQREKDSHGTVGGATEAATNPESVYLGDQESRDYTRMFDVELLKLFLTYSKDFDSNSNLLVNGYVYKDDTQYISSPQTKDATGTTDSTLTDEDYVYDNDYAQIQKGIKSELRSSFDSFATLIGVDLRANTYENEVKYRVNQALITYGPYSVTPNYYLESDFKSSDKTDENVYAIYGEYKQNIIDNLSMTGNIRFDHINLDYNDYKKQHFTNNFNVYSYRIGANYIVTEDTSIYANYSTGFRAPTVSQLYAGDVSAYGSTINNPDLEPEESRNYEIGFRTTQKKINFDLALFQIDRKDFIMKSSGNYGDSDATDMWANIGGAKHRGVELSINGALHEQLLLNIAYTYLDAYYTKYNSFGIDLDANPNTNIVTYFNATGNDIPRTSKHQLNTVIDYMPLDGLQLTGEMNFKSHYYADDLNVIRIPARTIYNAVAKYKYTFGDYALEAFARVDNLFDKTYYATARSSGDRNEDGIFDAEDLSITVDQGRVYRAGLSVKF